MRRIYPFTVVLMIPVVIIFFTSGTNSGSGSPGGKTGSPGDGFQNCTECHVGTPSTEAMWIYSPELLLSGYNSGQTYDMFVIGLSSAPQKFGFEATAEATGGQKVGTFMVNPDGLTKLVNNNKSVTHTPAGTIPLTTEGTIWSFKWTAPETSTGNITFYAAVNVANGNGTNTGDQIKLSTFAISPAVGTVDRAHTNTFTVFPNPTSGMVKIYSDEPLAKVELMNLHGQLLLSESTTEKLLQIDLTNFPKGIYFVKAGKYTHRLILK